MFDYIKGTMDKKLWAKGVEFSLFFSLQMFNFLKYNYTSSYIFAY